MVFSIKYINLYCYMINKFVNNSTKSHLFRINTLLQPIQIRIRYRFQAMGKMINQCQFRFRLMIYATDNFVNLTYRDLIICPDKIKTMAFRDKRPRTILECKNTINNYTRHDHANIWLIEPQYFITKALIAQCF